MTLDTKLVDRPQEAQSAPAVPFWTESEASGLIGSIVRARAPTDSACAGQTGEIVRADPWGEEFTVLVEWLDCADDAPAFDEFTKLEAEATIEITRRST